MLSIALLVLACSTPEAPVEAPQADETHLPSDHAKPDAAAPPATDAPAETAARVNLNSATHAQLEAIPDMTPKMIHEFEEYRPYVSIAQFRKQIGKYVSADQVAKWEPHVFVPVVPNECDAATLMQLPGVDQAAADALIAKRPFADAAAFSTALEAAVGAEKAKAGAALLK